MGPSGISLLEQAVAALSLGNDPTDGSSLTSDELIEFARLRSRLDAAFAAQVGEFDRQGRWALDGRKAMSGWLESRCAMGHSEASRVVKRARFAHACPRSASAWHTGALTTEKIDRIAAVRRAAGAPEAFAEYEPALVALAIAGTPADVTDLGRQWLQALDAARDDDGTLAAAQIERQHLHISKTFGGMGVLSGEFTPIDREQIETALDREMDRLRTEGDTRLLSQQRADALVSILRQYNSQSINKGTNQPHMSIHVDLATWVGESIGLCETARGARLDRDTAMRLACNAVISIITHDGNSVPLDLFRTQRGFNREQRRALEYRDRGCRFPGCTRDATQTEAHHIDWWELLGPTNLENGVLLCWFHHRLVHEGRWTLKIDGDAVVEWYKPDGTHYGTSHPRTPPPCVRIPRRE